MKEINNQSELQSWKKEMKKFDYQCLISGTEVRNGGGGEGGVVFPFIHYKVCRFVYDTLHIAGISYV